MDLSVILTSFITLFAIMDPFASLPPFLAFVKDCDKRQVREVAQNAVVIAGIVAVVFLFAGPFVLSAISITLSDFRIAGGIVLALLGLENTLSFSFSKQKKQKMQSFAVLIGTPLLTGPGLMTSLIILNNENGFLPVVIALLLSLAASFVILRYSEKIRDVFGPRFIMVFSKVMGLFLIAIGISFIRIGIGGG